MSLNVRALYQVLKISRTAAEVGGDEDIQPVHLPIPCRRS